MQLTLIVKKNSRKSKKKDPIFIPIMARISIPFNLENQILEKEGKLQQKDVKSKRTFRRNGRNNKTFKL